METIEFAGCKFQYEKLDKDNFKKGACAFEMIDEDGDTQYLVFTPRSMSEDDKEINTPNDGVLCAACPNKQAALMVASAIGVAANFVRISKDKDEMRLRLDHEAKELAEQLGFDLDALESEISKLRSEGKSDTEVSEILRPRMEEFKKKGGSPSTDNGGKW